MRHGYSLAIYVMHHLANQSSISFPRLLNSTLPSCEMPTKIVLPPCVIWGNISYQSYGEYSAGRVNNNWLSHDAFICPAKFVVIVTTLPTLVTWNTQWEKLTNMPLVGGCGISRYLTSFAFRKSVFSGQRQGNCIFCLDKNTQK